MCEYFKLGCMCYALPFVQGSLASFLSTQNAILDQWCYVKFLGTRVSATSLTVACFIDSKDAGSTTIEFAYSQNNQQYPIRVGSSRSTNKVTISNLHISNINRQNWNVVPDSTPVADSYSKILVRFNAATIGDLTYKTNILPVNVLANTAIIKNDPASIYFNSSASYLQLTDYQQFKLTKDFTVET